jgi:phosphomethylpyrimidine synthase
MTENERADLERQSREAEDGMKAKSAEFMEKGGELYLSADGRNREAID